MTTTPTTERATDFKVADLSLAAFGRKEIELAQHEMPGLMACREEYGAAQPLKGARVTGSLHMTIQTAVLIETLTALGAEVRWCSCNIFSTQDHAAAAVVVGPDGTPDEPRGVPVYAWKGETLDEYWWCTEQVLLWPDGGGPNMILDDGGDATLLVHKGAEFEKAGAVPATTEADSEEYAVILDVLRRSLGESKDRWTKVAAGIKGVTEDIFITATGCFNVIKAEHMARMKHQAIVGNIGHFDNEIDMAGLAKLPGIKRENIKPQVDEWRFADGHTVIVLSEGRLLNLGNATGHPSFVMSASFSNQTLAHIELWTRREDYAAKTPDVTVLPKKLDEHVARL